VAARTRNLCTNIPAIIFPISALAIFWKFRNAEFSEVLKLRKTRGRKEAGPEFYSYHCNAIGSTVDSRQQEAGSWSWQLAAGISSKYCSKQ
jgi:hypothetical protein